VSHRIVVAAPTTELAADLAETVAAAGAQTVGTATTPAALSEALAAHDPDVVLVREDLSGAGIWSLVRETVIAHPYLAVVIASESGSAEVMAHAMDSGARAVVTLPLQVEDVADKIVSAAGWAATMRRVIGGDKEVVNGPVGSLVVLTGAKGGVGTTTIATHLALASVLDDPRRRVCLVDLDLTKGDVPVYLETQHRRTIVDLAPLAYDLTPRALSDAMVTHSSGLHVLLAPANGELGEQLTGPQVSAILTALRQQHDVVVVDAGAVLTDCSATAVEQADEVLVVTTPDVPALRGVRRAVEAWERLLLRKETAVQCLINRVDRRNDIQPETAAKIVGVRVTSTRLPAAFRALEPAENRRDPSLVQGVWKQRIGELAAELRVAAPVSLSKRNGRSPREETAGGRRKSRRGADAGQGAIELVGLVPLLLIVILFAWQAILTGASAYMASNSAQEGARAAAVGGDVTSAAKAAVPSWLADSVDVQQLGGTRVKVSITPPLLMPGARPMWMSVSSTAGSVSEVGW
jgi:pilus assembly protein CpaE